MAEAKNRARILILSHIMQFSLARRFGPLPGRNLSDMHFVSEDDKDAAQAGDLVVLQSAPASKWYIGWLIEKKRPEGYACDVYAIESIEDGEVCEWSNVSVLYYDRKQLEYNQQWRWTDKQHEFKDRWNSACYKQRDAYIHLPVHPIFDGDAVELAVRVRHGFSPTIIRKTFPNWRKVTKKMLLEFYDAAVAEHEAESAARKAARG